MINEIISGALIIVMSVCVLIFNQRNKDHPWMNYGLFGATLVLGIYKILEIPLELPKNIAPWIFLGLCLFFIVMGFFRFCKNKEKKEQAEQEQSPIEWTLNSDFSAHPESRSFFHIIL